MTRKFRTMENLIGEAVKDSAGRAGVVTGVHSRTMVLVTFRHGTYAMYANRLTFA